MVEFQWAEASETRSTRQSDLDRPDRLDGFPSDEAVEKATWRTWLCEQLPRPPLAGLPSQRPADSAPAGIDALSACKGPGLVRHTVAGSGDGTSVHELEEGEAATLVNVSKVPQCHLFKKHGAALSLSELFESCILSPSVCPCQLLPISSSKLSPGVVDELLVK